MIALLAATAGGSVVSAEQLDAFLVAFWIGCVVVCVLVGVVSLVGMFFGGRR